MRRTSDEVLLKEPDTTSASNTSCIAASASAMYSSIASSSGTPSASARSVACMTSFARYSSTMRWIGSFRCSKVVNSLPEREKKRTLALWRSTNVSTRKPSCFGSTPTGYLTLPL
ncbi:hypothetical protein D9M68_840750 [compost metagenome]